MSVSIKPHKLAFKAAWVLFIFLFVQGTHVSAQSFQVSGAGSTIVNGIYNYDTIFNGKPRYIESVDPSKSIFFNNGWRIVASSTEYYVSFDNVATPDLIVNWDGESGSGSRPNPTIIFYGPMITYTSDIFKESTDGNGTIENEIVLTYNGFGGDFLTGKVGENFLSTGKGSIANLPNGFTARLIYTGVNQLTLRILGAAAAHGTADNVSTLTMQLTNAAFNGGDASTVFNAVKNNLALQFRNTRTVCASGCDHTTIQAAVTAAVSGDIIQLAAATYTETNISFAFKEIVILGVTADQTIVQAHVNYDAATNRVISVDRGQLILKDVTVRHGKSLINGAGGILTFGNCQLELHRCAIVDNVVDYIGNDETFGGGIGMGLATKLVVRDCLIANNIIRKSGTGNTYGGGLYAVLSGTAHPFLIENTTFSNNSNVAANATTLGGGLAIRRSSIEINNCTFTGNSAKTSGGGAFLDPELSTNTYVIQNSILYGNTSDAGADLYRRQGFLNVSHSIIGIAAALSGAALNGTTVNVSSSNPLLVALANNGGPTATHAIGSNSPAINASNSNAAKADQRGLGVNLTRDIGAFEFDGVPIFGWTGTIDTDWTKAGNWVSGLVPTPSDEVRITEAAWISGNFPQVPNNAAVSLKQMQIESTVHIDVAAGGALQIEGNIQNDGVIQLSGNAGGDYGQIKFSGNYSGSGTIVKQQFLTPGWHNMAAPFSGNASLFGTIGQDVPGATAATQNLRYWNASIGNWENVSDGSEALVPGRGYLGFIGFAGIMEAPGILEIQGAPLTSCAIPLDYNTTTPTWQGFTGSENNGWNLVANPFLAALDFSEIVKTSVEDNFHTWNPATNAYFSWAPASPVTDRFIAPMQSFWVRANDANPSFGTITYSQTSTTQTPSYRKTDLISNHLVLKATELLDTLRTDVLVLALTNEPVTLGYDNGWDARKMKNPERTPNLYSMAGGTATSINAIPYGSNNQPMVIQLGFDVATPASRVYSIALDQQFLFDAHSVYLEDSHRKKFHNLKESSYQFVFDAEAIHRFKLHLGPQGTSPSAFSNSVLAWVYGNTAYLQSNQYQGVVRWSLVDLSGRDVQSLSAPIAFTPGQQLKFELPNLPAGLYVLQITTEQGVENIRVRL